MLQQVHVNELVSNLVQMEGSNLHLEVGAPPAIRVHSSPQYMEGYEVLRPVDIEHMLASIIPQKLVKEFEEDGKADFYYAVQDVGRFRVNAFRQRSSTSTLMCFILIGVPNFEDLNLPEVIGKLEREEHGITSLWGRTAVASRRCLCR